MIEAWQVEHRPWLYFFLRRFELTRWTLRGKVWHPETRWYARFLALYLAVTGYETERCMFCGWKVGVVWWCDDQVAWETVTGYSDGGGVSCMTCFDEKAQAKGLPLKWRVGPLRGYTEEEWWRIIQGNNSLNKPEQVSK